MSIEMIGQAIKSYKDDFKRNGNIRILLLLFSYRLSHWASLKRKKSILSNAYAIPIILMHRFITEWIFGLELPAATAIGRGLIIDHGYSIVVNKHSVIGDYCRIRHGVTIGCKLNSDGSQGKSPTLGDNVDVGAHALIIGDIIIGNNVSIGAGAVVITDVPSNTIAVGNPARIIKKII